MASSDLELMSRALFLAGNGLFTTQPNPRVGCVIVKNNQIIAEGWHQRAGEAHAEAAALAKLSAGEAEGATAYVTLEPCSHTGRTGPCADALIAAKVAKVVVAIEDPNPLVAGRGIQKLRDAGIEVEVGCMAAEAKDLNVGFMQRMSSQKPFIRCKLAMSLDGKTALNTGESAWITGEQSRADVQNWRARSSIMLTGADTVIIDKPRMNIRLDVEHADIPLAIIDSKLRVPVAAQCLALNKSYILTSAEAIKANPEKVSTLKSIGVELIEIPLSSGKLQLAAVIEWLNLQQCNEIHLECGANLAGAFLQENLVDELLIYQAPVILGDKAKGLAVLPEITDMQQRGEWSVYDSRQIGTDFRVQYRPKLRPS